VRLEVLADRRAVATRAAERIARVLRRRGPRRLVLASGKTVVPIYDALVRLHRLGRAPFGRAETFNLDELRLPPDDPASFRAFMERFLFSRVNLPAERIHFLRGGRRRSRKGMPAVRKGPPASGAPDLALAGIGVNGHVAYLEPGRALAPRTALVTLSAATRRASPPTGSVPSRARR
jgi:glucosamine-6-phosphate deaminase